MKNTMWVWGLAIVTGWSATATGANSIYIESKQVSPCAESVTVGVYLSNDQPINTIVVPLQVRSIDNGSFIDGHFTLNKSGRLAAFESLDVYNLTHHYSMGGVYLQDHDCPADGNGNTWDPALGPHDYVSPDAVLHAAFSLNDTTFLDPGTDGIPGAGTPSLTLAFGVACVPGVFEIDTTCVPPFAHVGFYGGELGLTEFVPQVTKSVIEIGGPFWSEDSISGVVTSDLILRQSVRLVGDLTIDPGVTLTILRGAEVLVSSFADSETGGLDSARTEIIVNGTLKIDDYPGSRPRLHSDSALDGAWYGIRVMPGGRFETGIGAVIESAVIGVTVAKGAIPDTLSGLTITDCSSVGIHTRSDVVALINDTVQGIWPGKGIYADSADPTIAHCLIDSCEYGLYTFLSSARFRDSRIDGPGVHGIYVKDGMLYEDIDTLRFTKDTVYGYFSTAQMSVGGISQCRVDSCGFISDFNGQRSPYGIKAAVGGSVRLRNSTIRDFATTGFDSFRSGSHLGRDKYENGGIGDYGNNSIYADTTGCGSCALRRAAHVGVGLDSMRADGNWWGASPPLASWFSGKVDRTPHLTAPLGKISPPEIDAPLVAAIPREHSLTQNYPNPFNSSTAIEFSLASPERVQVKIYNILGQVVRTLADREYIEGTYHVTWDGTNGDGQSVASGLYLYRIVAGEFTQSKKMVLLK